MSDRHGVRDALDAAANSERDGHSDRLSPRMTIAKKALLRRQLVRFLENLDPSLTINEVREELEND